MSFSSVDQILQLIAWVLALLELILGLYILLLNAWHTANRHIGLFLLLSAASNYALGRLIAAPDAGQALLPTLVLAAIAPTIQLMLLLIAVVLLRPGWLAGRWRRIWRLGYFMAFISLPLILLDVAAKTNLWYTGLDTATYSGGYVTLTEFAAGSLSLPLRVINIYGASIATIMLLLYLALRARDDRPLARRLTWLLLAAQITAGVIQLGLRGRLAGGLATIITNTVFVLAYAYAAFWQMISERRAQKGRLRPRLTALILVVTIPLLLAVVFFVSERAEKVIAQDANDRLQAVNRALVANVSMWLDLNVQALRQLVSQPDIISMDAGRQKPLLETMAAAYPHIYLVSTTDWWGMNVARSDDVALKDYGDRLWQIGARNGRDVTYQTLIGRTSGEPALVVSMPIHKELDTIAGVGMFASNLTDITQEVLAVRVGESGFAYVVDALNQVVAHPNPAFSASLTDLSAYPPVFALRGGARGAMSFTDEQGVRWRAYVEELDNGWGVVVQQPEAEMLSAVRDFRQLAWGVIGTGALLLLVLTALTIRQAFAPINTLTATAAAIAAGDLSRTAPVESEDELGILAAAFNDMTAQLGGLIDGLEQSVAQRTAQLERRAMQLQAAADVARVTTSVLNLNQLLNQSVTLIRERFDLYYIGLFLLDEMSRWVELRAATGEAGRVMVASGHRLKVGGSSVVGLCAAYGQARLVSDEALARSIEMGQEPARLDNPLLPDTRTELALPLTVRGKVIGVLDVQSEIENAFSQQDITALQALADQIAVAIDNARLFAEVQQSLGEAQAAQRRYLREAWSGFDAARPSISGYHYAGLDAAPDPDAWLPVMEDARQQMQAVVAPDSDGAATLGLPLTLRGETIGLLGLKKDDDSEWSQDDIAVAQAIADQVALSLENARLFDQSRRRAQHQTLVRELSEKMRRTNDIDAILNTAVQELGKALGTARAFVRLDVPSE